MFYKPKECVHLILGIETSCDETATSIVLDGQKILSHVISSQTNIHRQYGGVFPELACRKHTEMILPTIQESLQRAYISQHDIDAIAVTTRPGFIGSLLVGINTAKALSYALKIPLIDVNHLKAHIYAAMMNAPSPSFPAIGLVASGGHTCLFKINDFDQYFLLGCTKDDAAGEAFDKVARLLHLPYPGGEEIEKIAKMGSVIKNMFKPCAIPKEPCSFSFSGLKTQVYYALKAKSAPSTANLAATFQNVVLNDLIDKTLLAAHMHGISTIYVGGGVSCNKQFKTLFMQKKGDCSVFFPPIELSTDNGAMIAGLGYHLYQKNNRSASFDIKPEPNINCLAFY